MENIEFSWVLWLLVLIAADKWAWFRKKGHGQKFHTRLFTQAPLLLKVLDLALIIQIPHTTVSLIAQTCLLSVGKALYLITLLVYNVHCNHLLRSYWRGGGEGKGRGRALPKQLHNQLLVYINTNLDNPEILLDLSWCSWYFQVVRRFPFAWSNRNCLYNEYSIHM